MRTVRIEPGKKWLTVAPSLEKIADIHYDGVFERRRRHEFSFFVRLLYLEVVSIGDKQTEHRPLPVSPRSRPGKAS